MKGNKKIPPSVDAPDGKEAVTALWIGLLYSFRDEKARGNL